jgi:hypothetical protein
MALWFIGLIEEGGRFRAIDEHTEIPRRAALGLNHYPALLAAARAVVEHRSGPFVAHHSSRPHYEVDAELLASLRAAVEASTSGEE